MPDLGMAIRKLANLDGTNPYERVYIIRQILDKVFQQGYDEGYQASMRDKYVADELDGVYSRDAAKAERARIADHFEDLLATSEYRRRFEDRHAEHLGDGTSVNGLLAAVVDEIKAMGALPERTENA